MEIQNQKSIEEWQKEIAIMAYVLIIEKVIPNFNNTFFLIINCIALFFSNFLLVKLRALM
jgi:hypothetical protein